MILWGLLAAIHFINELFLFLLTSFARLLFLFRFLNVSFLFRIRFAFDFRLCFFLQFLFFLTVDLEDNSIHLNKNQFLQFKSLFENKIVQYSVKSTMDEDDWKTKGNLFNPPFLFKRNKSSICDKYLFLFAGKKTQTRFGPTHFNNDFSKQIRG